MLRALAFAIAMVLGFSAAAFSRFAGLLFYLWFAVFRPQEWMWFDVEQYRFSLIVGLMLIVPSLATGVWPNVTHPLSVCMILFLLAGLVGQMHAYDPETGWYYLNLLTKSVVVALILVTLVNTRRRFVQTLAVISGSLALHSTKFGLGFILTGGARVTSGIGGAMGENNAFGLAVARVIFLLLATAQNVRNPWIKLGFYAAVPLSALGVVSTYSRGAFLALVSGGLVYLMLQRRRFFALVLGTACVAGLLVFAPISSTYFDRVKTIRTYDEVGDDSARGRLHFWHVAWLMAKDNPLGIGFRNFESAYDQYDFRDGQFGFRRSVHNSHLQALTEAGYLGFLIWTVLFSLALWRLWKVRARHKNLDLDPDERRFYFTTANALIASIVTFIVGGTFGSETLSEFNWLTFAMVAALERMPLRSAAAEESAASVMADRRAAQATV